MEQKTTTTPAWVEEMHKWQKENPNERAVLCIATDNDSSINTLFGSSLQLTASLLAVMIDESGYVNICKDALSAKENLLAATALMQALKEAKKEDEPSNEEDEDKPAAPSVKDLLKTFLTKLADKL